MRRFLFCWVLLSVTGQASAYRLVIDGWEYQANDSFFQMSVDFKMIFAYNSDALNCRRQTGGPITFGASNFVTNSQAMRLLVGHYFLTEKILMVETYDGDVICDNRRPFTIPEISNDLIFKQGFEKDVLFRNGFE